MKIQHKHLLSRAALTAIMAAAGTLLLTAGCGGGSSETASLKSGAKTTQTGRAVFHVTWPVASAANSRLVPEAAQSIEIRVLDDKGKVVKTQILARPKTEVTLDELPAKKLVNVLRAFPNADATGVAQAEGRADVEIKPDETTKVSLTLQSTIDTLLLTPAESAELDEGELITLGVSPRNAEGEVVLTRPNSFRYVSLSPDIATVDAAGIITAVTGGTAVIEVTEIESDTKSTFTAAVNPVGRVVFSDIAANITGTGFTPTFFNVYASEYFEAGGAPIPNITYEGQALASEPGGANRALFVTLPPNLAVGQTQDVTLSTSNPYSVTFAETHLEKDSNGIEKYISRDFESTGGGTVTLVRREGNRYTLRFNNIHFEAINVNDSIATGRFTMKGTVTFVDRNSDPLD